MASKTNKSKRKQNVSRRVKEAQHKASEAQRKESEAINERDAAQAELSRYSMHFGGGDAEAALKEVEGFGARKAKLESSLKALQEEREAWEKERDAQLSSLGRVDETIRKEREVLEKREALIEEREASLREREASIAMTTSAQEEREAELEKLAESNDVKRLQRRLRSKMLKIEELTGHLRWYESEDREEGIRALEKEKCELETQLKAVRETNGRLRTKVQQKERELQAASFLLESAAESGQIKVKVKEDVKGGRVLELAQG